MAGTGLPIPKYGQDKAQPIGVIDGDKLSAAQSWASIAESSAKVAHEAQKTIDVEEHQQQIGYYAGQDVEIARQRTLMRDKYANDPEGFDNAWQGYQNGKLAEAPSWAVSHITKTLGSEGNSAYAGILAEKRSRDHTLAVDSLNASLKIADNELQAAAAAGNLNSPTGQAALVKYQSQVSAAVDSRMMSQEKADFLVDDARSRALGEVAGKEGVRIFQETGGNEREAVKYLQKEILENEDLKISPAARRRAFNAGRAAINIEKVGAHADRAEVTARGRDLLKAIESGQPYDVNELQDAKDDAMRVGAAALHRQLTVTSAVKQQTDHLSLAEKGRLAGSQNIYSAIYAQESGSGRNPATSVTGARGGMQIQPATWAQYARPGENIDNEQDNIAVGRRIIDDLSAKSGGDPARIAVGYFSGPGNIAPPGSPTPWKVDRADPTGKTVSSYVSDVMKRMGDGTGTYTREINKGIQDSLIKDARKSWPVMQQQISAGTLPDVDDLDAVRMAAALSGDEVWYKKVEEVALAGRIYQANKDKPQLDRQALQDRAGAELSAQTSKALQAAFAQDNKLLKDDQFSYALQKGAAKPDQLNISDSASFRATLANRSNVVQGVANDQGVAPSSVLRDTETAVVKQAIESGSTDTKLRLFSDMAGSLSEPIYKATMEKLGTDTLTMFAGSMAQQRPELAREILRGADLMSIEKTGDKQALVRPAFQEKIGRDLYPSASDQNNVTQAALAVYTARRGTSGALYDPTDTAGIEKAIEDVAGKITKRNGFKVAIPPGMTEGTFNKTMGALTPEALAPFGGAYDRNGKAFDSRFLGDRAALKQLGPGESNYVVGLPDATARDGFAPVLTDKGTPLVIDIKQIAAANPAAALTPYQAGLTRFRTGQVERLQDARRQSLEAP